MTDDEWTQVSLRVKARDKEAAKDQLEFGELSEVVRRAIKQAAYGEDVADHDALKKQLERKRDKRDKKRKEARAAEAEAEELDREVMKLEERMSQKKSRESKYEGHLESLESHLRAGENISVGHGAVSRAADIGGVPESEVIEELKDRNPNIPDHAFVDKIDTDQTWKGTEEV